MRSPTELFLPILLWLICPCNGRSWLGSTVGILPRLGSLVQQGKKEVGEKRQSAIPFDGSKPEYQPSEQNRRNHQAPLPPPPPPRETDETFVKDEKTINQQTNGTEAGVEECIPPYDTQYNSQYPPMSYPPPPFWGATPFNPYEAQPQHDGWFPGPPPGYWQAYRQPFHRELEDRMVKESNLISQIQNLTTSLAAIEQREDLHVRQLNILTERALDAEAAAASERNAAMELESNSAELRKQTITLQEKVNEWKRSCENLTNVREQNQNRIGEMEQTLSDRSVKVEDLAARVETARLDMERELYLAELEKRRQQRSRLSWLLGPSEIGEEDERVKDGQDLGRSSLLQALHNEREHVSELSETLDLVQQNNSAILEMVESRNMLVQELNDRVAVFEQDKVLLKAALRQLQKEIRDETPKTKKIADDLVVAKSKVEKMRSRVASMAAFHDKEAKLLRQALAKEEFCMNETLSNMSMIASYVDKLEERMASFAIAKRDLEIREQKCIGLMEQTVLLESEKDQLDAKIETFETEHKDFRDLIDDLEAEKITCDSDYGVLVKANYVLGNKTLELQESLDSLEQKVDQLRNDREESRSKVEDLQRQNTIQKEDLKALTKREHEIQALMQSAVDEVNALNMNLANKTSQLESLLKPPSVNPTKQPSVNSTSLPDTSSLVVDAAAAASNASLHNESSVLPSRTVAAVKNSTLVNETTLAAGNDQNLLTEVPAKPTNGSVAGGPQRTHGFQNKTLSNNRPAVSSNSLIGTGQTLLANVTQLVARQNWSYPASKVSKFLGMNQTKSKQINRAVPLRKVRKTFAKLTGVHGFFTPSTRQQRRSQNSGIRRAANTTLNRNQKAKGTIKEMT